MRPAKPPGWVPLLAWLLCACAATATVTSPPPTGAPPPATDSPPPSPTAGWTLLFADEFDGPGLDESVWHTSLRWGRTNRNEAQYYAEDAFSFQDGVLRISAERRPMYGKDYTSGVIASYDRFTFTYGYVEMRARLPAGQGLWPAFWLLTVDEPRGGINEIDVFELLGHEPTVLYMTLHWPDVFGRDQDQSQSFSGPDLSQDFHLFAVDWRPEAVIWYVDGIERARVDHDIPAGPMYLIANLAVGGDWPGFPDATTPFPAFYDIDYIRVYQNP